MIQAFSGFRSSELTPPGDVTPPPLIFFVKPEKWSKPEGAEEGLFSFLESFRKVLFTLIFKATRTRTAEKLRGQVRDSCRR